MGLVMRRRCGSLVVAGAVVAAVGLGGAAPVAAAPVSSEAGVVSAGVPQQMRALWVDAWEPGLFSGAEVSSLVATAKQMGVNTLVVQTVRRSDCLCNKSILPRAAGTGAAQFDPLADVVAKGHAAGLQVHAWVVVGKMWSGASAPSDPRHVFNVHGPGTKDSWSDRRYDGTVSADGTTFLDLGNPAARKHVVATVDSIQKNYAIDGVNLDYIRYPDQTASGRLDNDWGYTPVALAAFRRTFKTTGTPAPGDPLWHRFRRDQVTAVVRGVHDQMMRRDKRDRLSVNAIAFGQGPGASTNWTRTDGFRQTVQDIPRWTHQKIVDSVFVMNYRSASDATQRRYFTSWVQGMAALQKRDGRTMVSGNAMWNNTIAQSIAQYQEAARAGVGWAGYAYSTMTIPDPQVGVSAQRALVAGTFGNGPFRVKAAVPSMPWKKLK
ncbi:family 10 glycosylhydrolase [Dermatophilus congolensis]|uniref:family 10 glycosylhydrolase n=2 Tax=Dermatophilus congolensis TaxID=1863 RepID=UPI001AAF52E5|nr:family 10 glycosylhydrolase [Dermatophilus congolensis]MBO3130946.1 family 10 glycosylhydrolase [Dermatophilus congolensis]MBO3134895.1 family 10 glycosylhydrolase [Dermatophilus congolensis]MBO3137133.1 family 10 glycosylhydrolase [Dermatophilus congolensis]MBO3139377.1 family 10 glycosylhydrolase [Dermatophilus congolensis]